MNEIVVVRLDGEPLGKGRVRFVRETGRTYTPERTVTYEGRLAFAAQEVMAGRPLLSGPLSVMLDVRMPIAASWSKAKREAALSGKLSPTKKPDWDNLGKILDAFNLIVWLDDEQVVFAVVSKSYSDRPGIIVTVSEIGG